MDQAFGPQLIEVVAQRGQAVVLRCGTQGPQGVGVDLLGGESVGGGDVSEAHEGVHESQLSWMVEFEPGDAFAVGQDGGLGK